MQKWIEAQKREKRFWSKIKRNGMLMPEDSLDHFSTILGMVGVDKFKDKTLLAIGSGPKGGILMSLPSKLKVAVDPLFKTNLRETTSDINALTTTAENLPIRDNTFDIVFCINALDHMAEPRTAVYEIFRVTRKAFILMVHVVPQKRKALHALFHSTYMAKSILSRLLKTSKPLSYVIYGSFLVLSKLLNDDIRRITRDGYAHPHYLTFSDVINTLKRTGFLLKRLKIIPDVTYGTFKLNLCIIARK